MLPEISHHNNRMRQGQNITIGHLTNRVSFQVVTADIFSAEDLAKHFTGCDAVVSCLGVGSSSLSGVIWPEGLYSRSIKCIAEGMRKAGVRRLLCMSGWHTESRFNHWRKTTRSNFSAQCATERTRLLASTGLGYPPVEWSNGRTWGYV